MLYKKHNNRDSHLIKLIYRLCSLYVGRGVCLKTHPRDALKCLSNKI